MDVDTKPAAPKKSIVAATVAPSQSGTPSGTRPGTPARKEEHILPEEDIYLTLLVILHLLDTKEISKVWSNNPVIDG
jgi:hypothetical protein